MKNFCAVCLVVLLCFTCTKYAGSAVWSIGKCVKPQVEKVSSENRDAPGIVVIFEGTKHPSDSLASGELNCYLSHDPDDISLEGVIKIYSSDSSGNLTLQATQEVLEKGRDVCIENVCR